MYRQIRRRKAEGTRILIQSAGSSYWNSVNSYGVDNRPQERPPRDCVGQLERTPPHAGSVAWPAIGHRKSTRRLRPVARTRCNEQSLRRTHRSPPWGSNSLELPMLALFG